MISWASVGILIVIAIAIGMGITVLIIKYTREKEDDEDKPFIINFLSHYCNGRFYGVQKDLKIGKDNREIITMSPRDVLPKNIDEMNDEIVIADSNKIIELPKGKPSREKTVKIILPKNADDFPQSLKNTDFGKVLMLYTEFKNADKTEIVAFKEGLKRQSAHIEAMGTGEATVGHMAYLTSLFEDYVNAVMKNARKDNSPSSPSLLSSSHGMN